jgi:uncharacterized protein YecT (DUF1311 family)
MRMRLPMSSTVVVLAALVALLVGQPTTSEASSSRATTTTIPCTSPQLTTDYQIDQCLDSKIRTVTARMNSSLRKESTYFRYATNSHDLRVAKRTQSTFLSYAREECLAQSNPYETGTIVPIIYGECVLGLYDQRLSNLRQTIASFERGGEAQNAS